MWNKFFILLLLVAMLACVDEDPIIEDFTLDVNVSSNSPVEGNGFGSFQDEDRDVVQITFDHSGTLNDVIPIEISLSGTSTEGEDFPSFPTAFAYNPFLAFNENVMSFSITDDLIFEDDQEDLIITFGYEVNGELLEVRETIEIVDNDFRFEITWENESSGTSDLEMIMRRNHDYVFFDLGLGEDAGENRKIFDISGASDKWKTNTGYGCLVEYTGNSGSTGDIDYVCTLFLPDGNKIQYFGTFEENDYLESSTNLQLPIVVFPEIDLYSMDLYIFFEDGSTDLVSIEI